MDNLQQVLVELVKTHWVDVVWIIALFILGRFMLKHIVKKTVGIVKHTNGGRESIEKRAETLGHVIVTTGSIVIYIIILLMVMRLFGVDVTPILAGAGIIGLAIGFGAQSLVKDFVTGLFILIENQYGVGDKVKIGASEGIVEKITIRSTMLRGEDGKKLYIANGTINNVVNYSQK